MYNGDLAETFGKWFHRQYLEWQLTVPPTDSPISDFAHYLGISQPTASQLLKGRYLPKMTTIELIVNKLPKGNEAYDILGIRPNTSPDAVMFGLLDALGTELAPKLEAEWRKWTLAWVRKNAPGLLDKWEDRIEG